ncbi:MAG TPA: DUF1538 domain-containing protein [Vicinamibacterales bacterium]
MLLLLRTRLPEVLKAVAPLIAVVCLLQVTLVAAPAAVFLQFLAGAALAAIGMLLLLTGIDFGVLPMGRFIGAELPKRRSLTLILAVAFAIGFAVTVAEPDVLVLAGQVERASEGAVGSRMLAYVIATGVGIFAALGMLRVVWGFRMSVLLAIVYSVMIVLSFFSPAELVPLAYDAGSVTTGVLTAPVVLSLAIGVSSVLAGRSAVADGFGLLGLASAGPIIAVQLIGIAFA